MKKIAKAKKSRSYAQQKAVYGLIYVAPWLLGFILFFFTPLLNSIRYSLSQLDVGPTGISLIFIGFSNFIEALTIHTSFNRVFVESIMDMLVNVPLIVIFSLFIAVMLNQKFIGRPLVRAIFFLPVILASGIIARLDASSIVAQLGLADTENGMLNVFRGFELERMMLQAGLNEMIVGYLTGSVDRIYEIIGLSGVQIMIFLAGIQTIPSHLYEASKIEGATAYENFWKVTFPMVSPLILVNVLYTIIDSFTDNTITDLVRETAFATFNFGLSSAMAWIYFLAVALVLIISTHLISRLVFYYE